MLLLIAKLWVFMTIADYFAKLSLGFYSMHIPPYIDVCEIYSSLFIIINFSPLASAEYKENFCLAPRFLFC
jgi:hypothetical protein